MKHHGEYVRILCPILQDNTGRTTLTCDLPQSVALEALDGLQLLVGFTGDKPSILIQSATPITPERLKNLRVVLEDLMLCYCFEVQQHPNSFTPRFID